jgi:phage host-nuclease inhibitor protein Gam
MAVPELVLKSLNDVEAELGKLGKLRADRDEKLADLDADISTLNAKKDKLANPLDFKIKQCESNIIMFVNANMEQFRKPGKSKSVKFLTGVVKTKESDKWEYPKNDELVAILKELGLKEFVDTEEKPMKAGIRARSKNDPDILEKLGIEVNPEIDIKIETY